MKKVVCNLLALALIILSTTTIAFASDTNLDNRQVAQEFITYINNAYNENFNITITAELTNSELLEFKSFLTNTAEEQNIAKENAEKIKSYTKFNISSRALDYSIYSGKKVVTTDLPGSYTARLNQTIKAKVNAKNQVIGVTYVSTKGINCTFTSTGDGSGYGYGDLMEYINVSDRGHMYMSANHIVFDDEDYFISSSWDLAELA